MGGSLGVVRLGHGDQRHRLRLPAGDVRGLGDGGGDIVESGGCRRGQGVGGHDARYSGVVADLNRNLSPRRHAWLMTDERIGAALLPAIRALPPVRAWCSAITACREASGTGCS